MNRLWIVVVGLLFFFNANGQEFYYNLQSGYSIGAGKASIVTEQVINEMDVNGVIESSNIQRTKAVSLGQGFKIGTSFGYMFNDNIGAELMFGYHIGSSYTSFVEQTSLLAPDISERRSLSEEGSYFVMAPSVVFQAEMGDWRPYAKFGLGLFKAKVNDRYLEGDYDISGSYKGGMQLGGISSLGIDYSLANNFMIGLEVGYTAFSFTPRSYRTYSYIFQNFEALDQVPNYYTRINFVEEFEEPSVIDESKARELPQITYPFTSVNIQLSLKVILFKKQSSSFDSE